MALDGITLHGIKRELQEALTGGWIRKVYQPRPELVTINVWNGEDYTLLISCGDNFRVQLTELDFENPQTPPPFTMLLRKHLSGGKIKRITQHGLDRVLRLSVGVKDEDTDEIETKELYVELMGRNSNLFLVRDGQILETLRNRKSRKRSVSPGSEYEFPPAQDKLNPFNLTRAEFYDFFGSEESVWRNLLHNIQGIGPTLAKEITVRAGIPTGQKELSEADLSALWEAAEEFFARLKRIDAGDYSALVYQEDGNPVEFSPIRLESYGDSEEISFDSLSLALDHYYKAKEAGFETEDLRAEIGETIENELGRVDGALKNVREQLQQSENREKLKETGDIILANLGELEKGMKEAEIDDPYHQGERRKVKLDPSLSPEENAEKYYERYKKLKRGKEKLDRRKKGLKKEKKYLEKLQQEFEAAETPEELARLEGKLKEKGYIETEEEYGGDGESGGPKEYWVKGYKILVGRNARQNDNLVRQASRDDLWFHIRNYSGAHVVIVTDGRPDQVPEEVIVKAARLAAANSRARGAEKATVSYTQVKYVDKPKGAKPGLVQITNEKTLTVTPQR